MNVYINLEHKIAICLFFDTWQIEYLYVGCWLFVSYQLFL